MPQRNYAREAKRRGWVWDEGGPHWFRPSLHPFHHAGEYAKTAREAVEENAKESA